MMMKRSRDELVINESLATVANYLMMMSGRASPSTSSEVVSAPPTKQRVFECKTCNRQFPSFQALGGHRASHKKPRLSSASGDGAANSSETSSISNVNSSPAKPKTHECSVCGLDFPIGQALGGHMRRHRAVVYGGPGLLPDTTLTLSLSCPATATVVKKPAERPVCLDLNLNLATRDSSGMEVGKMAPIFG